VNQHVITINSQNCNRSDIFETTVACPMTDLCLFIAGCLLFAFVQTTAEVSSTANRLRYDKKLHSASRRLEPESLLGRMNLDRRASVGSLNDVILNATPNMDTIFKIKCVQQNALLMNKTC
jgi:hypothetical protein